MNIIKLKNAVNLQKKLVLKFMLAMDLIIKTTKILSKLKEIKEFNIGHFIIGESIVIGLKNTLLKNSKKYKNIIYENTRHRCRYC